MNFIQRISGILLVLTSVYVPVIFQLNGANGQKYSLNHGAVDDEEALVEKLLKNYNKKLRPSGTVQVKFALNLNQIIKLIEKDQIFMLNVFIDHEWTDQRLSWEPSDYGNLTVIRISSENLWTPDTFVYTTADQSGFLLPQAGAYFVVSSTGNIFWPNPLTQMRVRCRMGIAWFPFDDQLCILVFGSWSYTYTYLNYTLIDETPSLENYTENNEWHLMGYKPIREEIKFDNWIEDDFFSEIRYKILIRRKPLFVLQNFVIPALMLCIITLVTFFVPFAQEMQLGISIMLAFSVFKLRLSDDVPVQSDSIPLINIYFTGCMSFSLSAMIWFSLMNIYKEKKQVPKKLRNFILNYATYVICSRKYKMSKCCQSNERRESIELNQGEKYGFEIEKPLLKPNYMKGSKSSEYSDVWLPQKNNESMGTQLNITMSESFLTFDQIRSRTTGTNTNLTNTSSHNTSISLSPKRSTNKITETKLLDNNNQKTQKPLIIKNSASVVNSAVTNEVSSMVSDKSNLTDLDLIVILNRLVFLLFLAFIIFLNIFCLVVFPYLIKVPLTIDESV